MFTGPQSDPVTFWQPSFSLPNIIVVASEKAAITPFLPSVCPADAAMEMVHVTNPLDALALVERGRLAAVLLVEAQAGEGWTQLIVNGLARQKAPRFVVMPKRAPLTHGQGWVRLHPAVNDPAAFRSLVSACVAEAQRPPDKGAVTPLDFFRGVCCFQEAAWVRVTGEAGTGDLCFRGGNAVYAEAGRKSGRAAIDQILSWGPCTFEYRDFPAVMPTNANQSLTEATCGKNHTAAPVVETSSDLEEPTEFPAFAFEDTVEAGAVPADLDIEEPTEFPELSAESEAMEADAAATAAAASDDLDAPPFPEFSGADEPEIEASAAEPERSPELEAQAAPGGDFGLRSTIFLSVAVIEDGVLESCEPASSSSSFDAAAVYHLFHGMERYSQAQAMGGTHSVLLRATQTSLVVARVAGTEKILAARLSGTRFGAAEDMEMHRLMEQVTAPVVFR